MELQNKVAIVTGGARGLGEMTAKTLRDKEAKVCVFDIENLRCLNGIDYFKCDLTKSEEVESAVKGVINKYGTVDILINNAEFVHSEPLISFSMDGIKTHSYENWQKIIDTNL
ncbi:MAG: SDR family NAD(P)-dependent oxidoreductase, partial [Thermodesulfovibrionales bacterium]|nr:SDR family NAD(P)-dependent oxidoreductase [Thermodesulfovibrionales bacterium]